MKNNCDQCGLCCKYICLKTEGMSSDGMKWLGYHNKCYIFKDKLFIVVKCKHLKRKNNKYICDIHNTDAYPEVCKNAACLIKTNNKEAEFFKELCK